MSVLTYTFQDVTGNEFTIKHKYNPDTDISKLVIEADTDESTPGNNPIDETNEEQVEVDAGTDTDGCQLNPEESDIEAIDIDIAIDIFPPPLPPVVTSPVTPKPMKYAPIVPPVKGNYNLYCISLIWNDNPGAQLSNVTASGQSTAKIYKTLSNGNFNLNVIGKAIKVDFDHNAKNIPYAEKQAKRIATAGQKNNNPNLFIIVNNKAKGFSNGGGDTAHLYGTLVRDFLHELGHCKPLQLEHSGRVMENGEFESYADGTSFMSKLNSIQLTAAQLYTLGWLPQNKVALYEFGFAPVEFKITKLKASNDVDGVKAVMIPLEGQKPLFLSMPTINNENMLALHQPYGNRGAVGTGTRRLLVFSNQASYQNLSFQKVSETDDYAVVRISATEPGPKPPTKPTPKP